MCVFIIGPLGVPIQLYGSAVAGSGPWLPKGAPARTVNRLLAHRSTPLPHAYPGLSSGPICVAPLLAASSPGRGARVVLSLCGSPQLLQQAQDRQRQRRDSFPLDGGRTKGWGRSIALSLWRRSPECLRRYSHEEICVPRLGRSAAGDSGSLRFFRHGGSGGQAGAGGPSGRCRSGSPGGRCGPSGSRRGCGPSGTRRGCGPSGTRRGCGPSGTRRGCGPGGPRRGCGPRSGACTTTLTGEICRRPRR
jgi:hypothetical protein